MIAKMTTEKDAFLGSLWLSQMDVLLNVRRCSDVTSTSYGEWTTIQGWAGTTTCVSGATRIVSNPYYSQCLPGVVSSSSTAMATKPSSTPSTTNKPATSSVPTTLMSDPSPACSASLTSRVTGKLSHVGINIAVFDFGCLTLDATLMDLANILGTGIGNGMGNNGYVPAVPAHASDLDAHYWKNMFIELGFGDTVERNSSTNPSNISTSTNMNINSISSAINNSKT
ncbi:hypothetical protein CVT25_001748 [Psilocybe cyanescens]|uniref:CBM1 domain-containing protein n=1 Tax=Psilocybe cyanescens TaxID=93625 RepID=A0A409XSJ0_PSICY|nr:hypothetical protein CVT25_001748 [Psilocybe cyanescens]